MQHEFFVDINILEEPYEVKVGYEFTLGEKSMAANFDHPGEPGSDDTIEIVTIKLYPVDKGCAGPADIHGQLFEMVKSYLLDQHRDEMIAEAKGE